jgi:hypothetical protein
LGFLGRAWPGPFLFSHMERQRPQGKEKGFRSKPKQSPSTYSHFLLWLIRVFLSFFELFFCFVFH